MTQTRFKKVPFDLELAKKITNKEMKGQIVTENGLTARKICFDLKYGESKIIAALVDCGDYKIWVRCDLDGTCRDTRKKDKFNLHIEVPNNENRLSNKNKQMTRTTYKRIPFNFELSKKITNKEIKGHIVTRDGRQARIICFDRKETDDIFDPPKNIIALVENKDGSEGVFAFRNTGMILLTEETDHDLQIEVPTYYRDYSNFVPQKWQPCLVRENEDEIWLLQVSKGKRCGDVVLFYSPDGSPNVWRHYLPLSKVTERLIGTRESYEELIQELDNEQGKD